MFKIGKNFRCFLYVGLSVSFVLTAIFPNRVYAQKCGDVITDEYVAKYFEKNGCSTRAIFKISAIVGERAIPSLQNLLKSGRCGESMEIYAALARLGDQEAFTELEKQLYERNNNSNAIRNLAFVRNDQAISRLMIFFSKYRSDPLLRHSIQHELRISPLGTLALAIWSITFAWDIPAVVDIPERKQGFFTQLTDKEQDEWEAWWDKQKDRPFSSPDFSNISDAQLRCLARMTEWGLPEAVMSMIELPGKEKEVESMLKTFPKGERLQFGTMSGTIEAALLRLGDDIVLAALTRDLRVKESYVRDRAIQKIRIASTKTGIETLLSALEAEITGVSETESNEFRGKILNALSRMVEEPPLGANTAPTPENFLKWKQWWMDNKDAAILKRPSVNDMEWGHRMGR